MSNELKAYRFALATENSNLGGVVYNSNYVYAQEDVDAILAKKDAEIAELKKKLMPCLNGDCILTCEVVEKYGKENAELKAENERLAKQSSCTFSDDSLRVRQLKRKIADNSEKILELQKALDVALSEVYSLLDKIESLKASHYAESVQLRHSNHKRCLAMAKYCEAMRGHYLSYEEPKWFWYRKWSERWLALAEKFKEAK